MYRLIATAGHDVWSFPVPEEEAVLGTARTSDLLLPASGVSRRHALICRCPGGIEVKNLESRNGLHVSGRQVEHAILTPGLRVQIGTAWLELEELSSSEAELAACIRAPAARRASISRVTDSAATESDESAGASPEAAIALACHVEVTDANDPEERTGLLARARNALGARTLAFFEQRRSNVVLLEDDGEPLSGQSWQSLTSLVTVRRAWPKGEVKLKRAGGLLLAGRDPYFLVAQFEEEEHTTHGWRQDFVRFLFLSTFIPPTGVKATTKRIIQRVFLATGRNASGTGRLLGLTRPTVKTATKHLKANKNSGS
jgi:hypothetical protein